MKSLRMNRKGSEPRRFLRPKKHGKSLQGIPIDPLFLIHQLPKRSDEGSTLVVAERTQRPTSDRDISH